MRPLQQTHARPAPSAKIVGTACERETVLRVPGLGVDVP